MRPAEEASRRSPAIGRGSRGSSARTIRAPRSTKDSSAPRRRPASRPDRSCRIVDDAERDIFGITLQDRIDVGKALTLTLGARYDSYSDFEDRVTPRIAVVWRASDRHILKAQYTEGFRPPTFFELYSPVPPNRVPRYAFEVNATTELNYVFRAANSVGRATLFRSIISNMIRPGGVLTDPNARAQGLELEWSQQLAPSLKLDANLSYVDTIDPRQPGPGFPERSNPIASPWFGNLSLFYRPLAGLVFGARMSYGSRSRAGRRAQARGPHGVARTAQIQCARRRKKHLRFGAAVLHRVTDRSPEFVAVPRPHRVRADFVETMSAGRILVADDNGVNRMLLSGILEMHGYEVRVATNGLEVLELLERDLPELVLLDIQMPGLDGLETCRRLRSRPRTRAIPVIFISALDDVGEKLRGFEAGGVDYVTKPFEAAEVLARVGSQVKLFRLNHELAERNRELERRNQQLMLAQQKTERMFTAMSTALTGTVLDDTYRLEEKIGEGGFGAVFRGVHLQLRRNVAVKVLRPGGVNSDELLARFRREAIAACRVAHPNAIDVVHFGVSSTGVAYLVMELLSGRTLGSLLREKGPLPPTRVAEIVLPVCDALLAAHAAGILHRDIKPDNVFLHRGANGEVVKVVDFGIAKLLDESSSPDATVAGTFLGTLSYMAPERLLSNSCDERSDIYSVGVLLYFALSGALPFDPAAPTLPEMVKLHLSSKARPLLDACADVPAELAEMVMQALDPEPRLRPGLALIAERLQSGVRRRQSPL